MFYHNLSHLFCFLDKQDIDIRVGILKIFEEFQVEKGVIEEYGSFKLLIVHLFALLRPILSLLLLLIILALARILYQILYFPK